MTERPPVPVVPVADVAGVSGEASNPDAPEERGVPDGQAVEITSGPGRRRWDLAVHLSVYAVALIAMAPFMRVNAAWSVDEGLYVYQVRALQQGDWNLDYWAEPIDPDGRWFPLRNEEQGGESFFPYVRSPTYPLLMWAATRVVGDSIGLHLLPIIGAIGAAAAAWFLASQIDRRVAPFAFWVTALGPVVINAYVVWAHAPSAAVAGFTAYAAVRALKGGLKATSLAALCVGVASGVLLRTEGLLFAAAVSAVLGAIGAFRLLIRAPNPVRALGLAAAVGTTALVVNALESRWVVSIVGEYLTNDYVRGGDGELSYWAGKLQGARHILLEQNYHHPASTSVTVAVLAALVAGLALRRRSRRAEAAGAVAVFVACAALAVRFVGFPPDTIPGIIPAWPIVVVGLLLFRWRAASQAEWLLVGVVVLELLATLATQYAEGGGVEWGARYLSPLYPLLSVLAAFALYRTVQSSSTTARQRFVPLMVLLALIPAAGGLRAQTGLRAYLDWPTQIVEDGRGVVITSHQWLGQRGFRTYPAHEWLHVQEPEFATALERLEEAGYKDVIVLRRLSVWSAEPSDLPGGYRVKRDLGEAVYLTHP